MRDGTDTRPKRFSLDCLWRAALERSCRAQTSCSVMTRYVSRVQEPRYLSCQEGQRGLFLQAFSFFFTQAELLGGSSPDL